MGYIETAKKTLWGLNEKDLEGLLREGFAHSLTYFAILLSIASAAYAVLVFVATGNALISVIAAAFNIITYALGIGLLLPAISHFLIGLFGGRRPVTDTFQIYFYASTPSLLLGWVPCIGGLTPLVSFGSAFRGLREINKLGFWQTVVAVLLPSLAYWGLWIAFMVGVNSMAG